MTTLKTTQTERGKRRRYAVAAGLLAVMAALVPLGQQTGAHAATPSAVLDQQETNQGGGYLRIGPVNTYNNAWGQTFTPGISGSLTTIVLRLSAFKADPTLPLTVQVFATANGLPTGAALDTGSVPASYVSYHSIAWVPVTFPNSPHLTAGAQYAFTLSTQNSTDYTIYLSSDSTIYAGGALLGNIGYGWYVVQPSQLNGSFDFQTYMVPDMVSDPSNTWTPCAAEGGTCAVSGTELVAFGANGQYVYRTATSYMNCTIAAFGSDPALFALSSCYSLPLPTASTWTPCAAEGGTCVVSGTALVAFGANGQFNYLVVSGSISCTNSVFGGDPIPGTVKACYAVPQPN